MLTSKPLRTFKHLITHHTEFKLIGSEFFDHLEFNHFSKLLKHFQIIMPSKYLAKCRFQQKCSKPLNKIGNFQSSRFSGKAQEFPPNYFSKIRLLCYSVQYYVNFTDQVALHILASNLWHSCQILSEGKVSK